MVERERRTLASGIAAFCTLAVTVLPLAAAARDYDIVYVRQPRYGDTTNTTWPEVAHPASLEPGADLMLLHPDGSEELLVAGGNGAVTDPFVSFDGRFVYYSQFPDVRPQAYNYQRGLPYDGADIYPAADRGAERAFARRDRRSPGQRDARRSPLLDRRRARADAHLRLSAADRDGRPGKRPRLERSRSTPAEARPLARRRGREDAAVPHQSA
jgi:hypothetical protein